VTGGSFADAIQAQVFARCGMAGSGFFHTDRLPARTASAYIQDPDGSWRTNIFSVPAAGMPDGGAYTTAPDMARFWDALWNHHLLSPETTARLCQPHVRVSADDDRYYGYGVWLLKPEETVTRVYALGGDPGVAFISAVFPLAQVEITCLANTDGALWSLFPALVEALGV
jgi:CubicO group peptidase (beta-lactamase class C family)